MNTLVGNLSKEALSAGVMESKYQQKLVYPSAIINSKENIDEDEVPEPEDTKYVELKAKDLGKDLKLVESSHPTIKPGQPSSTIKDEYEKLLAIAAQEYKLQYLMSKGVRCKTPLRNCNHHEKEFDLVRLQN